ncbi:DUF5805 domain-containing protein [Haloplanus halophilus]|uniref:DUF5805 domain-containing protein n=1 Tax=Haloplanus halophilus TaxID=2949993 RepID=UPI002040B1EB|nr:DUF5805 domain-containing protein [Haloplanus sp. GDY1]
MGDDAVPVKTYVPPYQKERWEEHADRLGMSQSEFVRTMVQAGRRDFEVPEPPSHDDGGGAGSSGLEPRVREALDAEDGRSWDDLLERVTEDVEDRLEETLQELQEENVVQYSGRAGGYRLVEDS